MRRRVWAWDEPKRMAARMVASGGMTLDQVADQVGVSRRTLYAWRQTMEFRRRVNQILGRFAGSLRRESLARIRAEYEQFFASQNYTKLYKNRRV